MSSEDPGRDLLLHVIEMQAEGIRLLGAVNKALLERRRNGKPESVRDHTGYGPSNPRHRTWRGFVLDMQRQARELPGGVKRTKTNVATHGVDTVRAINYAMRGYGLSLRDWPPDTWDPDEDRKWQSPKRQ
jgi:hypothetical protein